MKALFLATVGLASAFAVPASATVLLGKSIGIQYIFPVSSTVLEDYGSNLVGTDGPTLGLFGEFTFSFTDTTVTTTGFTFDGEFVNDPFNGFRLYDVNGTIASFTGVTIDPSTIMPGLDASRITFDANNIYVNWQGLEISPSITMTLNITAAVPEPASWAMLIAGFGLTGAAMRRRRAALAA